MIGALTNHLWQSTLFAFAASLLIWSLRGNGAHVRYWVWLTTSVKFLVPFSLFVSAGGYLSQPMPAIGSSVPAAATISLAVQQFAEPFPVALQPGPPPGTSVNWIALVAGLWACGLLAIAAFRLRGWWRIRTAVRASSPVAMTASGRIEVRASPALFEPGVVGVWRPILLVPESLTARMTPAQLHAVIVHELCHVRRRDNLTAAVHMVVEAVFWFHPLVWWIGARLIEERERACDEAVLSLGMEPREYAEGILNVCKLCVESPLACVSGVTGSNLKRRIHGILRGHIVRDLTIGKKAVLSIGAMAAVAMPVAVGMVTALSAESVFGRSTQSVQPARFEVASIRRCEGDREPEGRGARGRGGAGGTTSASPGRLMIQCATVEGLINTAHVRNGAALLNDSGMGTTGARRIDGGPGWVRSEKYTIEAKAEEAADQKTMMGPMLRTLLEERFQLKIHRELEESPMYALTIAKGGLKIQPMGEDGCTPPDQSSAPQTRESVDNFLASLRAGGKPVCGMMTMSHNGALRRWDFGGQTLPGLASVLSSAMDRHVLDRTGNADTFNLHLEFAPDEHTPGRNASTPIAPTAEPADPSGPTIFRALEQQLGLKLEPTKGQHEFIVIDRVERPSSNGGAPNVDPPSRARGGR